MNNQIPEIYHGKPLIHAWNYCAMDGVAFGIVGRYQDGDGKKEVVPFFKRNGSNWAAGIELNPRPLFRLDKLAMQPKNKAVFIVEGEKPAAALQSLGITAVTSLGGSQAAKKADWMPLSGNKIVYLLPDNDEPGNHYIKDIVEMLMALPEQPQIKILRLPDLPEKGDVVDWLQNHAPDWDGLEPFPPSEKQWVLSELRAEVMKAESVLEEWILNIEQSKKLPHPDWENPVEITVKLKPVMPFDLDLLPEIFKPWIKDVSYRMGCPVDYVAVSAMVALSALVGKNGLIHPKKHDDWTVCPNMWGLNVGRPSWLKTPASQEGTKPLVRLEIEAKKDHETALAVDAAQDFINKEGRVLAEKEAREHIKNKKFAKATQVLMENPSDIPKPTRTRYMVSDPTIEKLGELLNENPNGLLLYRDEISGFLKTIDREDRANDRAFYTEAFNGLGRYTYDRIGRGTIDIENLCVAILGNIQPGVLRPYLSQAINGTSGDDGMIQRFQLMVWPDLKGSKPVDQWPDTTAKNKAHEVFIRLAAWEGWKEPARFTHEAQLLFNNWYEELLIEIRADDIQPAIESHYGKYPSLVPSLAALIHLVDDEHQKTVIDVDIIKKALAWIPYLKSHAERVYSSALDPIDANAQMILDKLGCNKLQDGFGTGDVIRGGWTGLSKLADVKAAIDRLIDYGWLKKIIAQPMAIGRPSSKYSINPIIFQKHTT